jgi:transcriptional regulator with XRE-family HTH domain
MFRFNPDQLGERLHALRRRHGQTLRELGTQAEVNYVTLSKIERGKMPQVSADIVVRLAVALGVSADYLLGVPEAAQAAPTATKPSLDAQEATTPPAKRQRTRQAASVA